MKSILALLSLVIAQSYEDEESYDIEKLGLGDSKNYQQGLYYSGNEIGTTPVERMMFAAASTPQEYDCKKCKNDIGCLAFCSDLVIRGRVVKGVEVLCEFKSAAKGKALNGRKAKGKKARKAKKAKKAPEDDQDEEVDLPKPKKAMAKGVKKAKPKEEDLEMEDVEDAKPASAFETADEDFEVIPEPSYEDQESFENQEMYNQDVEPTLYKRSNNSKKEPKPKTIRVKIPKKCRKSSGTFILFLKKRAKKYRLVGGCMGIQNDSAAVQQQLTKMGLVGQGTRCSATNTRALKQGNSAYKNQSFLFLIGLLML